MSAWFMPLVLSQSLVEATMMYEASMLLVSNASTTVKPSTVSKSALQSGSVGAQSNNVRASSTYKTNQSIDDV